MSYRCYTLLNSEKEVSAMITTTHFIVLFVVFALIFAAIAAFSIYMQDHRNQDGTGFDERQQAEFIKGFRDGFICYAIGLYLVLSLAIAMDFTAQQYHDALSALFAAGIGVAAVSSTLRGAHLQRKDKPAVIIALYAVCAAVMFFFAFTSDLSRHTINPLVMGINCVLLIAATVFRMVLERRDSEEE